MKKNYYLAFLLIFSLAPMMMANFGGSPGGRTGSPGDNGGTCTTNGGCHGPKATIPQDMLSTDVGSNGYTPNDTILVTIAPTRAGINKYGFEIIAEDPSGNPHGKFIGSSTVTAASGGIRATHKAQSTQGSNDMHMWTMQWVAPDAGTGDLKFYVSVLAANNNGGNGGDNALIDTLEITENLTANISKIVASEINIYPNPVSSTLHVNSELGTADELYIYDGNGKKVFTGSKTSSIDVNQLSPGTYTLKMVKDGAIISKSFIKL